MDAVKDVLASGKICVIDIEPYVSFSWKSIHLLLLVALAKVYCYFFGLGTTS